MKNWCTLQFHVFENGDYEDFSYQVSDESSYQCVSKRFDLTSKGSI